jgi:hypothetical protein
MDVGDDMYPARSALNWQIMDGPAPQDELEAAGLIKHSRANSDCIFVPRTATARARAALAAAKEQA